jgi:CPA2 family monovalent cation:H+ antiporter-2
MQIDYRAFVDVAGTGLVLFFAAVSGKLLAGFLAGRWQGLPNAASWNIGFAMVAKGEFSIILAGVAAQVARPDLHLGALIAFLVLLLSITGPTMMKESFTIINAVGRAWAASREALFGRRATPRASGG